jgi:hypothetical protein
MKLNIDIIINMIELFVRLYKIYKIFKIKYKI